MDGDSALVRTSRGWLYDLAGMKEKGDLYLSVQAGCAIYRAKFGRYPAWVSLCGSLVGPTARAIRKWLTDNGIAVYLHWGEEDGLVMEADNGRPQR